MSNALIRDLVDIPVANIGNVKFSTVVTPKAGRIVQRVIADTSRKQSRSDVSEVRRDVPVVTERPDSARKVSAIRTEGIGENIEALKLANQSSAINVAADYANTGRVVRIIENRINKGSWSVLRAGALNQAFADTPSVICAREIGPFLHINLFAKTPSNVGNKHRARFTIKTAPPRLAQAKRVNLLFNRGRLSCEGISRRD